MVTGCAYGGTIVMFPSVLQGAGEVAFAFGALSFPLYALHYPVLTWMIALGAQWWSAMMLAPIVCCGLGLVIDRRLRAALLPDSLAAGQTASA